MTWIPFRERWPDRDTTAEVIIRSPQLTTDRLAGWNSFYGDWMLSDCTHPMQNCWFSKTDAEWLSD